MLEAIASGKTKNTDFNSQNIALGQLLSAPAYYRSSLQERHPGSDSLEQPHRIKPAVPTDDHDLVSIDSFAATANVIWHRHGVHIDSGNDRRMSRWSFKLRIAVPFKVAMMLALSARPFRQRHATAHKRIEPRAECP
ncbi:hypothetical protein PO883_23470 [Massilia sp. DJPM01]|uniref:hypothetical protein n=1 Tax=Massilia sp. DJPM01 TaxID=3024404 RepID=UPI00259ED4CF|nr:hypothetical protein [Massilia sp. DJPM01]MDM5180148.1 hypothetical protein [Massilia sp. DJPM01]